MIDKWPYIWRVFRVFIMANIMAHEIMRQRYGRHLDQVILCAVYGVCKVNALPVKFHQIVQVRTT